MNIEFTARHVRLHPRLREIVETKFAKMERVLPRGAEARVVVTAGRKDLEVEVTVSGRHPITATARGTDQTGAAQEVMDRIAAQAAKSKTRVKGAKKGAASGARNVSGWNALEPEEAAPSPGTRRESVSPRAMFEEDALSAFAASRREVLVFRDPAFDNGLRFLYRRRDGSFGLVVPE
jgi:putative sigma-54 modulation protein